MTDWRQIADALAEELRRLPCRRHESCPRCDALRAYDRAVADSQIIQTPEVAARLTEKGSA